MAIYSEERKRNRQILDQQVDERLEAGLTGNLDHYERIDESYRRGRIDILNELIQEASTGISKIPSETTRQQP